MEGGALVGVTKVRLLRVLVEVHFRMFLLLPLWAEVLEEQEGKMIRSSQVRLSFFPS